MDLFAIEKKRYKGIFMQVQISNVIAIVGSLVLVYFGGVMLLGYYLAQKIMLPVLGLVVLLSLFHTRYQRKQLAGLLTIINFEERLFVYEKFYRFRMLWYLFSCFVSCFLSVLTGRYLFVFYAAFDVLISSAFYPKIQLFRRELKNEEIVLY